MNEEAREKLQELIRNNVIDVITSGEIDDLIDEGYINYKDNIVEVQKDGLTYLIHKCNHRCLVPNENGKLICRPTNYQKTIINIVHTMMEVPNKYSKQCMERLEKDGLATLVRDEHSNVISFKISEDYFHPKKNMPP